MEEKPSAKTKIGDRVRITHVPGGITNISPDVEGIVIKEPVVVADFVEVEIELDDVRTIVWKEDNLEVITSTSQLVEAEIVEENSFGQSLEELERIIADGLRSLYEVGFALREVNANRLYKQAGYKTFELYCQQRWGMTRVSAYRFIKAKGVIDNLNNYKKSQQKNEISILQNPENRKSVTNRLQNPENRKSVTNRLQNPENRKSVTNRLQNPENEKSVTNWLQNDLLPTTESQARILAAQDRDLQPIIWGKAVENAGGIPTAKIVEKIAKEVVDEMKTSKSSSQTENECCHGTETICQKRFFAPGDVVRIISKNQWGIVKQIKEFSAIVMTTLGENKAQLVDLMPVEEIATASDRVMAKELMLRLQKAAAALVGKDEAIAVKWIQDVARKDVPKLSDLEEEFLVAIENIIIGGQKQSSLAVNANLILDGFVNNLEYLGTEQIKSFMGAIATRKKEAITEAAIGLADDEDKAIEVIRAIARKYPNAIRQAIEEF